MRIMRTVSIGLPLILATLAPEVAEAQPPGQGTCSGCDIALICVEFNEMGQCVETEPGTACFHDLETGREDCADNAPAYTFCENLGDSCESSLMVGFTPENAAEGFSGSVYFGYTSCASKNILLAGPLPVTLLSVRVPVLLDAPTPDAPATGIE